MAHRPIERVIIRMRDEGLSVPEIATKLRKMPGTIERMIAMLEHGGDSDRARPRSDDRLRPIERVVLQRRADGESYGEIGSRIRRSGAHARRIEEYARYKLASVE